MDTDWIYMALASLGRLGSWKILRITGRLGQRGQCEMELHGIGIPGILDLRHPSRQTNPWIPIGYPWHWHPGVDWDPGQSSPFKADWDSVGQCEMDWDNAYPLDLHGIGIPG